MDEGGVAARLCMVGVALVGINRRQGTVTLV